MSAVERLNEMRGVVYQADWSQGMKAMLASIIGEVENIAEAMEQRDEPEDRCAGWPEDGEACGVCGRVHSPLDADERDQELAKLREFKRITHAALDAIGAPEMADHECRVRVRIEYVGRQIAMEEGMGDGRASLTALTQEREDMRRTLRAAQEELDEVRSSRDGWESSARIVGQQCRELADDQARWQREGEEARQEVSALMGARNSHWSELMRLWNIVGGVSEDADTAYIARTSLATYMRSWRSNNDGE